jgi:hypothetical protein
MELLMADLVKLLVALAVVAVLAAVVMNTIVPAIMLAGVGYSLYYVWRGLNS